MYLKKLFLASNWYITTSVTRGNRGGTLVRALSSHQCGLVSYPSYVRRGLSLLLVVVPSPRIFRRVFSVSSLCKNQHCQIPTSIWKLRTNSHFVEVPLLNPIYFFIFILLMSFFIEIRVLWRYTYEWYFEENAQSILMRTRVDRGTTTTPKTRRETPKGSARNQESWVEGVWSSNCPVLSFPVNRMQ